MVMLKMFSFDHFYEALTDMGVDEVQDLIKVTDEDICDFQVPARWSSGDSRDGERRVVQRADMKLLRSHVTMRFNVTSLSSMRLTS